jgi:hypothetical protein
VSCSLRIHVEAPYPATDGRLALMRGSASDFLMSNKEVVSDLLTRLPDDVSLQQIAREVEFVAGVREGLEQLDRGDGVEIEKVEKLIESWTTK